MAVDLDADLPDLSGDLAVEATTIERFAQLGHACVRGLATAEEVAAFRPRIRAAAEADSRETRPLDERDTYGRAFLQVPNLWRRHPDVARFVLSPRFGRVAAALLGVDRVRLYHDQALFKEAGGGHTPWHQDQAYWPLDTDRTITMWMPLVPVRGGNGSMTFGDGTHRMGDLGGGLISDASEAAYDRAVAERGISCTTYDDLAPGDATFHAGWTLHRAAPNATGEVREVMTVIWFADGARLVDPIPPTQELDARAWLPGCAPGDLAASAKNPVVG